MMPLDNSLLPMKDYHKAKKLMWNPQDLDYSQDIQDWRGFDEREQTMVSRVVALFLAGETFVTHDLAPLLIALRREGGHLEEEMFLTTQLFEESKHVEFFDDAVGKIGIPLPEFHTIGAASYLKLFEGELAGALNRLLTDHSRQAQVEAVVTYHMIIEGVVAETGYYGLFTALRKNNLMPGLVQGLEYVQRDEARHVAFGLHLLQRLVKEDPSLWEVMENRLNYLFGVANNINLEILDPFLPNIPLGLDLNDVLTYSMGQFNARMNVLNRAKVA